MTIYNIVLAAAVLLLVGVLIFMKKKNSEA